MPGNLSMESPENFVKCPGDPYPGFGELLLDDRQSERIILIAELCAGFHYGPGSRHTICQLGDLQRFSRPGFRIAPRPLCSHFRVGQKIEIPKPDLFVYSMALDYERIPELMQIRADAKEPDLQ